MKRFFNILLAVLLVVPVLSVAAPCSMSVKVEKQSMAQMAGGVNDCPHHQKQLSKTCDNIMSMADCFHLDVMANVDHAKTHDVLKSDVIPPTVFSSILLEQLAFLDKGVRAPPLVHQAPQSSRSIVLTTQRFRI